jgi:hypothetical protein
VSARRCAILIAASLGVLPHGPAQDRSPGAPSRPARVEIVEKTDRFVVRIDGEPFTEYRFTAATKPILYPVLAPGGLPVTRGFPVEPRPREARDHPHHVSMWFAHGDVNGRDFWHDPTARIEHVAVEKVRGGEGHGELIVRSDWMAAGETVVCRERRAMRFSGGESWRAIDLEITLEAPEAPIVFGDTKEGTMALRLAPTLRLEGEHARGAALNSEGVKGSAIWGKRARWTAYRGPVNDRPVTVAMFDHPSNPRHPTWWHARPYGLFAANPFGRRAFEGADSPDGRLTVPTGASVTFRYRVLIRLGSTDASQLESAWRRWARSGP